jgi:SOS response regulatory protein OraA/RecX
MNRMMMPEQMMAEGDEPEMMPSSKDIDEGLMELQKIQPETKMLDQFVAQVIQMIQAGASEQEVIQMLLQAGLDEEDINAVFQSVIETLEGVSIDQQIQNLG